MRLDAATGRVVWKSSAGKTLSAGPGAGASLIAVGTSKGEVLAFDTDGKPLWTARVSSEVIAPPRGVRRHRHRVLGRRPHLRARCCRRQDACGSISGPIPPLTVRNAAGGVVSRGGLLVGTPGGRLLAIDCKTGRSRGTRPSPRRRARRSSSASPTSRACPTSTKGEVCAAAYQGRVACFDLAARHVALVARRVEPRRASPPTRSDCTSSTTRASCRRFDRSNGASVWKQDVLAKRRDRRTAAPR